MPGKDSPHDTPGNAPKNVQSFDADIVTTVGPHDVQLGRGAPITQNPGNIQLRELVVARQDAFRAAIRQKEKHQVAVGIWKEIEARGGRFLQQVPVRSADPTTTVSNDNGQVGWMIVHDSHKILVKIKQLLRDMRTEALSKRNHRRLYRYRKLGRQSSDTKAPSDSQQAPRQGLDSTDTSKPDAVQHGPFAPPPLMPSGRNVIGPMPWLGAAPALLQQRTGGTTGSDTHGGGTTTTMPLELPLSPPHPNAAISSALARQLQLQQQRLLLAQLSHQSGQAPPLNPSLGLLRPPSNEIMGQILFQRFPYPSQSSWGVPSNDLASNLLQPSDPRLLTHAFASANPMQNTIDTSMRFPSVLHHSAMASYYPSLPRPTDPAVGAQALHNSQVSHLEDRAPSISSVSGAAHDNAQGRSASADKSSERKTGSTQAPMDPSS